MFTNILVAIDDSPQAMAALRAGCLFAKAGTGNLALVHVIDMTKMNALPVDVGTSSLDPLELLNHAADTLLKGAEKTAATHGVTATSKVLYGTPAHSIAEYAKENNTDVIVMGSHAFGGVARLLLGSVAEGVLHACDLPVLAVGDAVARDELQSHIPLKRILVSYDGSVQAEHALEFAAQLAVQFGAELAVCYVVDVARTLSVLGTSPLAADSIVKSLTEQGRDALQSAMTLAHPVRLETYLRQGFPVSEILACAAAAGADLIVTGSHGRRGLARLFLGSVSSGIIGGSNVPVLIAPSKAQHSGKTAMNIAPVTTAARPAPV